LYTPQLKTSQQVAVLNPLTAVLILRDINLYNHPQYLTERLMKKIASPGL